jgi:signal transduction histidine kinase
MRPATLRATFVTVLLVLTVLIATLLTQQAVSADRDHRASAERVLRDYAALGADGAAGRLQAALSARFYGVLVAAAELASVTPAGVASVRAGTTGAARDVASRFSRLARVDTATGHVEFAGAALSPGDAKALADTIRAALKALPQSAYLGMQWLTTATGTDLVVFTPMRAAASRPRAAALTMPLDELKAMIVQGIATERVIPPSLSHGAPVDSGVQLVLTSRAGEIARRGHVSYSRFLAVRDLGPVYAGMRLEVTLSESLAPLLLASGLPQSRTPLVFALFAVMAGLIVAAGYQVRRERDLARLRDDFVASVSHELRTPLAQIRLFAETLRLARVRSPEEEARSLAIVENESKRLEHLVGNVLHFSRAERGGIAISRERVDLGALLGSIASDFAPLAERAGSAIAVHADPGVRADIDPAAMRQVVLNLLDNAVKYGRAGQTLVLRLATDGGALRIEVENEGESIPAVERARIWERFWRGESARRAGITGTGIGLAIVRDIVASHGGSATAEELPAGGTRIVVRLPVTRA